MRLKAPKISKTLLISFSIGLMMSSCASSYQLIQPHRMNYNSKSVSNDVILEYRYDLLEKKYAKKETKKGVRLVAVRITNNSDEDYTVGEDLKFVYDDGRKAYVMDTETAFKALKQSPASYLFYLLLAPVNLYTTNVSGNQIETKSFPIGLIVGPGLAIGNIAAAGSANKKLKQQLNGLNVMGMKVAPGKTASGLICIRSSSYNSLNLASDYVEPSKDELIGTER